MAAEQYYWTRYEFMTDNKKKPRTIKIKIKCFHYITMI